MSDAQLDFINSQENSVLFCGGLGSGKCIIEGTLVKTPKGAVKIEDLKIGDLVYGYNNDGTISLTEVTNVIDQGIKEVVDLEMYGKVVATSTEDHRWLTARKRDGKEVRKVKRVKNFIEGKEGIKKYYVEAPGGDKDVPEAYALGAMLGDGCYTHKGDRYLFSSEDKDVVDKVARGLNGDYIKYNADNFTWRITGDQRFELYDKWCKGRKAHEKTADIAEIRTWNRKSQIEFISGLIDTDGCVRLTSGFNGSKRLHISLSMQAKDVVDTARDIILDLFQVQVTETVDNRDKYKNGPVYGFKVSNNRECKLILKELNTVLKRKQYKSEYDKLKEGKYGDICHVKQGKKYKAQCWDITVNNETHLYLLANGMVTHNTFAGAVWAVTMALKYPNVRGMITANTHSQLRKATLVTLFGVLDMMGLSYKYLINNSEIHIQGGAIVYAYSMEQYDNLRGVEVGWAWSDECAFYKEMAYQVLRGRIRDKKGTCQWKGTTTPNGFNWLYDRFVTSPAKSSEVVYSKTMDNIVNLADSYVDELTQQYDSKLAQQELDGQFVNLTSGKVYYGFDRAKNSTEFDEFNRHIYVGLDFNVNPLCGIYANIIGDKIYVYDELYLEDSNTIQASREIKAKNPGRLVQVVADATGDRRKTSAVNTDHEILRRHGLEVLNFRNPYVKDRVNNVNRLLEQGRIIIHPRCAKTILDLEQLVYDNKDEKLSHISDALGYLAWWAFPLRKPKKQVEIRTY